MEGDKNMEGKIISIKEIKTIGMVYYGGNCAGEIPELWRVFNQNYMNIKHKSSSQLCYGICDDMPDVEGKFHYAACSQVDSFEDIPEGMEVKIIPEGKYVMYTYSGLIENLGEFYENIVSKWMPALKYEMDCRPQFELYDNRFMENGEFDIYMPIK
jgi:AraC family transcriptional regulator